MRQNWQLTAQPIWLETQMVARRDAGTDRLVPAAISLLSPVAPRHPDRLHRLPVLARNQVALRAVDGAEGLDNPGTGDDPALVRHSLAQLAG